MTMIQLMHNKYKQNINNPIKFVDLSCINCTANILYLPCVSDKQYLQMIAPTSIPMMKMIAMMRKMKISSVTKLNFGSLSELARLNLLMILLLVVISFGLPLSASKETSSNLTWECFLSKQISTFSVLSFSIPSCITTDPDMFRSWIDWTN